ncbi:MAG TPA: hypothetical protein ENF75_07290 [Acidilobales archaeon]|nr:MAG: hypothetical protein DRO18_07150 [Thermoprotei archaeon]HDD26869.1 hypothetical protein [Acidilobales archaeon]
MGVTFETGKQTLVWYEVTFKVAEVTDEYFVVLPKDIEGGLIGAAHVERPVSEGSEYKILK